MHFGIPRAAKRKGEVFFFLTKNNVSLPCFSNTNLPEKFFAEAKTKLRLQFPRRFGRGRLPASVMPQEEYLF